MYGSQHITYSPHDGGTDVEARDMSIMQMAADVLATSRLLLHPTRPSSPIVIFSNTRIGLLNSC